jgi:host factor-I protein
VWLVVGLLFLRVDVDLAFILLLSPRREVFMVNRKLIRPSLSEIKDQMPRYGATPRKRVPPEVTNAENYYYIKQMAAKTPMVVRLTDGEEIRGIIEWYDKSCIKVHRQDGPNLLILKQVIKYMYKQNEDQEQDEVDLE